ncbi:MAG: hypothetical protein AAF500_16450 [Myxococcota bacterium]
MTWRDDIVLALRNLGGSAGLSDIYAEVQQIRPHALSAEWQATVRNQIESWSSDSKNWRPGRADLFFSVGGKGSGVWALREEFRYEGWWEGIAREQFWMEITERPDVGADLNAPQFNDRGDEYWSYSFVRRAREGDIVLHYQRRGSTAGIVGASMVGGTAWEDQVVWGSKGESARKAKVEPYPRRGWRRALQKYLPLSPPLTLTDLRRSEPALREVKEALAGRFEKKPLYFPFDFSDKRPMRATQGYLVKFPADAVEAIPELRELVDALAATDPQTPKQGPGEAIHSFGADYRAADETAGVSAADPMSRDPAEVERGNRGHRMTQNTLARRLQEWGIVPLSPGTQDANFDVGWEHGHTVYVCEVKSTTPKNETKQLRLGLGQVLHYRASVQEGGRPCVAVLAVENQVSDPIWEKLCARLGVILVWPANFAERIPH